MKKQRPYSETIVRRTHTRRFYFSYKLGIKNELLNSELVKALKGKADAGTRSKVNECLNLCGMVEFAKYKSNQNDFDK